MIGDMKHSVVVICFLLITSYIHYIKARIKLQGSVQKCDALHKKSPLVKKMADVQGKNGRDFWTQHFKNDKKIESIQVNTARVLVDAESM